MMAKGNAPPPTDAVEVFLIRWAMQWRAHSFHNGMIESPMHRPESD